MSDYIVFIPAGVMIAYTLISRRIVEPVIIAVVLAFIIKYGIAFPEYLINGIYETIMQETIAFLIVMLLLFGGLIRIITVTNGINGIKNYFQNKIHTKRASLIMTWLLGISLFMDDYLNSLVVGSTMKKIADRFKVPREQLSIISITTSVPLCLMTPITTWAVFIFGVLKATSIDVSAGQVGTYMKIIPFALYPFICVLGTFLMTLGLIPPVFKLKEAYMRADKAQVHQDLVNIEEEGNALNFIFPIAILVTITIVTANIAYGITFSLFAMMIWLKLKKEMKISDFVDYVIDGMSEMIMPLVFIVFAFLFGHILTDLGFADTVLEMVGTGIRREFVPLISFWIVTLMVFSGIDVWAVIPLVLPILIPLANTYSVDVYLIIGTVFSGISLGTQVCFISESNILVSSTLELKPMDQVMALLPYALFYGVLTSIGYVVLGVYM